MSTSSVSWPQIHALFGRPATSPAVEALFDALRTYHRPELSEDDEYTYHDWVLVRRMGVELGFVAAQYQQGGPRGLWRKGDLLLTQAYFYAGFGDVLRYTGELPFGLRWEDTRGTARAKLVAYEATRHSYQTDTWDVDGWRLTVTYADDGSAIDRIACRVMPAPLTPPQPLTCPSIAALTAAFGEGVRSAAFAALWPGTKLGKDDFKAAREDREIDFTQSYGATLGFAVDDGVRGKGGDEPVFRSITLHTERDMESVGWRGPLPHGLSFEDDPTTLAHKIVQGLGLPPVQHSNSGLTGHAVWHFPDHTLHVLYSNFDNRLLRVKLIAPGTWKSMAEIAAEDDDAEDGD